MKHRILIVDNDEVHLKLASGLLETAETEVQRAADAKAALEILKQNRPHIMLVNTELPGMDGLTLTKVLKNDSDTSDIIILLFIPEVNREEEEKIKAAGGDGLIKKPLDPEKFHGHVRSFLQR